MPEDGIPLLTWVPHVTQADGDGWWEQKHYKDYQTTIILSHL